MSNDQQGRAVVVTTPTEVEIHVERVFDAPRDQVFATFTDPALIPEWWGHGTVVEHMDVRPGGSWRFTGNGMVFAGEYREVAPPERLVQTFTRAGFPGGHLETMTFEDLGEQTRFTMTMLFDTTEDRDNVLTYGGEAGMNETYTRLDSLLAGVAAR
jgi:uncharacterized protein YndB with AHSA1/START domain